MTPRSAGEREEFIVRRLMKADGHVSGEELAHLLRISRTAVWHHVSALKWMGFQIESQPHLGYRLLSEPDVLHPAVVGYGIEGRRIGRRIVYLARARSSNDEAEALARGGEPEGAVVIVEEQTSGRGRMGRRWQAQKGKGVCLSVILRPALPPARVSFLTLCSAVAAREAIRSFCPGSEVAVKWPNDVMIGGRKACGILTELSTEADRVHHAIVGVGINANQSVEDLKGVGGATSIRIEAGKRVSRPGIARAFLRAMDEGYALVQAGRFGEIIDRWLGVSETIGRRIRAESLAGERWEGVATGLDDDGCLLLRLDTGMTRRITGGDVTLL